MDENRIAKRVAVAVASLFLGATPGLTREQSAPSSSLRQSAALVRAQSSPAAATQIPPKTSPAARAKKPPVQTDIFAGLQYTDDQKAQISKILQDMKSRRDAVVKDDKLSPEQKGAFLQGFERMERSEIYNVLTPEQKTEVRKRMQALRLEAQKDLQDKKLPPKK